VSCVRFSVHSFDADNMSRFGGFGGDFMKEYHSICPKTEPVGECDDRVMLYELYHHLNHHAMYVYR
jgi:fructosamine-3-kinase